MKLIHCPFNTCKFQLMIIRCGIKKKHNIKIISIQMGRSVDENGAKHARCAEQWELQQTRWHVNWFQYQWSIINKGNQLNIELHPLTNSECYSDQDHKINIEDSGWIANVQNT